MKKYLSSQNLISSSIFLAAFIFSSFGQAHEPNHFSLSEYWAAGQKVNLQFNTEEPADPTS